MSIQVLREYKSLPKILKLIPTEPDPTELLARQLYVPPSDDWRLVRDNVDRTVVLSNWLLAIDTLELVVTVVPPFCQYGVARGLAVTEQLSVADAPI